MINWIISYKIDNYNYFTQTNDEPTILYGIILHYSIKEDRFTILMNNSSTYILQPNQLKFLTLHEQIEKFHEFFYQYLSLPKHLILKTIKK